MGACCRLLGEWSSFGQGTSTCQLGQAWVEGNHNHNDKSLDVQGKDDAKRLLQDFKMVVPLSELDKAYRQHVLHLPSCKNIK